MKRPTGPVRPQRKTRLDEYSTNTVKKGTLENRDPDAYRVQPPSMDGFAKPSHVGTRPIKPKRT